MKRLRHREMAQYISDLWGKEDVKQRIEGESESSRSFEMTQGRSVSHSYTERSQVRIQHVLKLETEEFFGQLVESDFSSFKAQINAPEPGPQPEIVPVTTATSQAIKQNFIRIQQEVESLFTMQGPDRGRITGPVIPELFTPAPLESQAKQNGQNQHMGENLDF